MKREALLLLQWLDYGEFVYLFFRPLDGLEWTQVRMNSYPDHLVICGESIFLLGGEELFIFTPSSYRTDIKQLQKDAIVSVHPFIC
jgi:hypothetical protein